MNIKSLNDFDTTRVDYDNKLARIDIERNYNCDNFLIQLYFKIYLFRYSILFRCENGKLEFIPIKCLCKNCGRIRYMFKININIH